MPPTPPEGVHTGQEQPAYSKMMGALVDQVKEVVEKDSAAKEGPGPFEAYVKEVGTCRRFVSQSSRPPSCIGQERGA